MMLLMHCHHVYGTSTHSMNIEVSGSLTGSLSFSWTICCSNVLSDNANASTSCT